jgi:transposase
MVTTKKIRKNYSSEFKSKVVIEILKERQTMSELSVKHGIHQVQLSKWKQEFLEKSKDLFSVEKKDTSSERLVDELYKRIGQLEMDNQFLKKNLMLK